MSTVSTSRSPKAAKARKARTAADRPIVRIPLTIPRVFSTEGVHPYDEVTWTRRDVVQTNWKTGEEVFSQHGVEFPEFWSENAATIVTTKYFRGALGTDARETSLRQLVDRVVDTYVAAAAGHDYFASPANVAVFGDELRWLLIHQYFSFNSPVWFNVGTASAQQVSACFILHVEDTMDSILNWYREEGMIFKGGSGAGVNLSSIRSSKELLASSGGSPSGPVSFMRGADASAGTIKSGGATRRAAKMVVLDVDHPDIEEFVATKAREENKIRVLRDAGYDMDLGGADITSVQYQNANNSVRVSDEFMSAVRDGAEFGLRSRTTGEIIDRVDARGLFAHITQAAWECADPGIQYNDTINAWHTNANTGPITASNPCSEYMSLDNSSCNLASLNLLKFRTDDGGFDAGRFAAAVEVVITAMDVSICFADFPTESIGETTRRFRQLGIGYANLGALLMASGLAYDSDAGRAYAAAITSLMTAVSYRRSAQMAAAVGAYDGYAANAEPHTAVMAKHAQASHDRTAASELDAHVLAAANEQWEQALAIGGVHGWRNAQASVLAPTGTIGFMMDCDTTGIEPDFSLVKFKKLVGGSSMRIVNQAIPAALHTLGYGPDVIADVSAHVLEHGNVVDAPGLAHAHYSVFDTATGERSISAMGHVAMMAAVQPFLSGAISKTVNMPEDATVADVAEIYMAGWEYGLKALAIYRDNCKVGQPLSSATTAATEPVDDEEIVPIPVRRRLPRSRVARSTKFTIGDTSGYLTTGEYDTGELGEIFIRVSKQGSTLSGMMDGLAMAVSVGLQYGVPLETFVAKYVGSSFEPAGLTNDPDVRMASSMLDWMFKHLAICYLPTDVRQAYGIYTTAERTAAAEGYAPVTPAPVVEAPAAPAVRTVELPLCTTCGTSKFMVRTGACMACSQCGTSSGCS